MHGHCQQKLFLWFRFGRRALVELDLLNGKWEARKRWRKEGGSANSEMGNTCTRYVGLGEPGRVYLVRYPEGRLHSRHIKSYRE